MHHLRTKIEIAAPVERGRFLLVEAIGRTICEPMKKAWCDRSVAKIRICRRQGTNAGFVLFSQLGSCQW